MRASIPGLIPMLLARALLVVALLATTPALADSLEIGPTRLQMVGPERTTTLTIRNANDTPANIQIRALDWSQSDGTDQYSPSTLLLASPPQVSLAPGESQVIRVVIETLPAADREHAFRLMIDQIPSEQSPGGAGVRTAVRALVPVFVTATVADRPSLQWRAVRNGTTVTLTVVNAGPAHDRIVGAAVTADGAPIGDPIEGYVLADAQRSWTLEGVPGDARSLSIAGEGEFGEVRADVPLAP
ncbi:MAG: molecular chaperone [Caulobacteraceae bacterium]|nr:molecular chaperone [Caulobacteraceae bacterium]